MNESQSRTNFRFVSEADFESAVSSTTKPVLAVFSTPWSRPCEVIDSVLAEVKTACNGEVTILKINADDNPHLSLWYGVDSIPTLLCFVAGKLRERLVGTASKQAILDLLRRHSTGGSGPASPWKQ